MSRIYFDPTRPKPTSMEASSRFWCGAAVGLLLGAILFVSFFVSSPLVGAATCVAIALMCGALAVPYGEDFWYWMRNVLRFLRYWW